MSAPTHHPPPEDLLLVATGGHAPAVDLVLRAHLHRCPSCADEVRRLEAAGAALCEEAPLPANFADQLLRRLGEPPPPPPVRPPPDPLFPPDLARLLGPSSALRWQPLAPGLSFVPVPLPAPVEVPPRVYRFRPGYFIPHHAHHGDERAALLAGGWTGPDGDYGPGDYYAGFDGQTDHWQRIHDDGPCIALVVNDRPMELPGLRGLLARWFKV